MLSTLRSLWIWTAVVALILLWLPLLAVIRLFDGDPVRYRTGFWFRRLGRAMTTVNPAWRLHISGETIDNPRRPYVVVSNHQSHADIPIISNLPWEMKWIGKAELFSIPVIGWMMALSRHSARQARQTKRREDAACRQQSSSAEMFRDVLSRGNEIAGWSRWPIQ